MAKDSERKTRCTKIYRFTSKEVADMAGVSESLVKKVRAGSYVSDSHNVQKVLMIDKVLQDRTNHLIQHIESLIKLPESA